MTYRDQQRLDDIAEAIAAIRAHVHRGGLSDGLVFDAVRIRLLEIGEAVKALPTELLAGEPTIPWHEIARMRDNLAHRARGARRSWCSSDGAATNSHRGRRLAALT